MTWEVRLFSLNSLNSQDSGLFWETLRWVCKNFEEKSKSHVPRDQDMGDEPLNQYPLGMSDMKGEVFYLYSQDSCLFGETLRWVCENCEEKSKSHFPGEQDMGDEPLKQIPFGVYDVKLPRQKIWNLMKLLILQRYCCFHQSALLDDLIR